jgi:hypothetical protein
MPRARNLKPSFFTDDELAEQPPLGRLLFQALWCLADREGRLEDKPRKIKAEALPYDTCNIDRLLKDLHDARFIVRYEHDGKRYIQIRQFLKHQNPHVKEHPSTIPAPDSPPAKHGAETGQAPENPERAGLIVDSGFPLPDSGFRIADAPSPPPDPGLPHPLREHRNGSAASPLVRPATAKTVGKRGESTPTAIGALTANALGMDPGELDRLGKEYGMQPKAKELRDEFHLRVAQERQKRAAA